MKEKGEGKNAIKLLAKKGIIVQNMGARVERRG